MKFSHIEIYFFNFILKYYLITKHDKKVNFLQEKLLHYQEYYFVIINNRRPNK